ncbi:hypothetical protein A3K63_03275 [Candidatus Micrarchaeota archaeon RBG_16_49_10]|nr:MAG: hypothetical protein A3K63_03275 [Candidatus Micrarchaeota archaeon RBG_16_49_10]
MMHVCAEKAKSLYTLLVSSKNIFNNYGWWESLTGKTTITQPYVAPTLCRRTTPQADQDYRPHHQFRPLEAFGRAINAISYGGAGLAFVRVAEPTSNLNDLLGLLGGAGASILTPAIRGPVMDAVNAAVGGGGFAYLAYLASHGNMEYIVPAAIAGAILNGAGNHLIPARTVPR